MQAEIGKPARQFYVSSSQFAELTLAGSEARPRLVGSLQNGTEEVWTISLSAKGLVATGNVRRMVQSTAGESHPRFSSDGRWLAFRSNRSGRSEIWLADSDGANPRQLTHVSAYAAGFPHWSPDGQSLVFHARFPGEPQLYVVRVVDGVVQEITYSKPGLRRHPGQTTVKLCTPMRPPMAKPTFIVSLSQAACPSYCGKEPTPIEVPGRELLLYDKEDKSGIYARSLAGDPTKNPERLLVADF
jgi:hypothetical protein